MGEVLAPRLYFPRLGSVAAVGLEARADELAALELDGPARTRALELAVSLLELHVLGPETPGAVRELCAAAADSSIAAVRLPARFAAAGRASLEGSAVRIEAAELVLDAPAYLCGRYGTVVEELASPSGVPRTVVVPTRELGGYDDVRHASLLAMFAGAGFVAAFSAPLATALCILEAIRDVRETAGRVVGFKAEGVDSAQDAVRRLVLVHETLGDAWLTPERCRIGGSMRLLDDLLSEIGSA